MAFEAWIGPVIIAAGISSIVAMIGWYVSFRQDNLKERKRRREKIRDFMIALRAEIRGEYHNLDETDFGENLKDVSARYKEKGYSVMVSTPTPHVIFDAIAPEIQLLPETVIDPIVLYTRQRYAIEAIVQDMRSDLFRTLSAERQLSIYTDYINMKRYLEVLAEYALEALDGEIGNHPS